MLYKYRNSSRDLNFICHLTAIHVEAGNAYIIIIIITTTTTTTTTIIIMLSFMKRKKNVGL